MFAVGSDIFCAWRSSIILSEVFHDIYLRILSTKAQPDMQAMLQNHTPPSA